MSLRRSVALKAAGCPVFAGVLIALAVSCCAGCGGPRLRGGLQAAAPPGPQELRVVTFNVARDFGLTTGQHTLLSPFVGTPANLLEDRDLAGAHVVALQEVCGLGDGAEVNRWLWRLPGVGWHARFVRHDPRRAGACGEGQLIAVRGSILASGVVALPRVRTAGRVATWVEFMRAGVRIRVWNLHLNGRASTLQPEAARLRQLTAVLVEIAAFRALRPRAVVVLLGDLNMRSAHEPGLIALSRSLRSAVTGGVATHLFGWPLDWIWVAGAEMRRWAVIPIRGSDHFAVAATLRLSGAFAPR